MAGLLQQNPKRPSPQAASIEADEDGQSATPEEEGERQELFAMAATLIHGEKTSDAIYRIMEAAPDPMQGLAMAAATVLVKVEGEVGEVSDAVKMQLGEDILEELLDLALAGGIVDESQLDDAAGDRLAAQVMKAYTKMREQSGRPFTPDEAAATLEKNKGTKYGQGINALSNDEAASAKEIMAMLQAGG
jgi:NTP pyrophosphatase (non-canonical NTP hydrolase)